MKNGVVFFSVVFLSIICISLTGCVREKQISNNDLIGVWGILTFDQNSNVIMRLDFVFYDDYICQEVGYMVSSTEIQYLVNRKCTYTINGTKVNVNVDNVVFNYNEQDFYLEYDNYQFKKISDDPCSMGYSLC